MSSAKIAPNTDNYILGKGVLYFDRFDSTGAKTGELDLGNVTNFSLNRELTKKEHLTSREGMKQVDLTIQESEKWKGKFTAEEYNNENMLLAISGQDVVEYETQSSSNTSVAIAARRNRWIDVGYRYISSVVVTHGGTTFTVGIDYDVDSIIGRIYPKLNGAIYEGEALTVAFNYAACNFPKMNPSVRETRGFLRFVSNNDQGPNYEVQIWSALMECTSDISFISDDWGKLDFAIDVDKEDDAHTTDPYFQIVEIKATTVIS